MQVECRAFQIFFWHLNSSFIPCFKHGFITCISFHFIVEHYKILQCFILLDSVRLCSITLNMSFLAYLCIFLIRFQKFISELCFYIFISYNWLYCIDNMSCFFYAKVNKLIIIFIRMTSWMTNSSKVS